ncbi:MAG: cadherin domain-containing protein, partial [Ekhidna sp.]|nr:cadherin domain-containing protein [Ekhidna sp.]
FSLNENTGALTFATAPDFERPEDQGSDNDYEVIVTVGDGTNSAMQTITVTVTDVNEPPVIAAQTFSIAENVAAGTAVGTVAATDEDGDELTFSVTSGNAIGDTGNAFAINASSGVITVVGTIDHETTPTYTLTVQASDGDLSATAAVTINVTNENDNSPMITSPATASVAEGTTAVLTVTATDADNDDLTYSVSGGADRSLFSINQNNGALAFKTAPDFEAPGSADNSNVYEAEVTVSDGTNSVAQTITVTVTNDPSDDILGFSEAEEATVIFPNPSGRYLEVRSSIEGAFQLLSLNGKSLLEGTTNTRVDITSLQGGLYLVKLPDGRLLKFVRE